MKFTDTGYRLLILFFLVTMEVSDTDSSSDNPAAAKRPKLGSPEDDDEDISIIEEHIDVGLNTRTLKLL